MENLNEAEALPCPCCAGVSVYWSNCLPVGSNYGRVVCRDCGLGTTPCPNTSKANALAQWNVRLINKDHSSDYWKAVHCEEARLNEIAGQRSGGGE